MLFYEVKNPQILVPGFPGGTVSGKRRYCGYEHNVFQKNYFDILETPFSADYEAGKKLIKDKTMALVGIWRSAGVKTSVICPEKCGI